jgi:hypothetical protein
MKWGLLAVAVSLTLLAAHFSWWGVPSLSIVSLLCAGLLFVKRPWAARTMQAVLFLASIEWIRSIFVYVGRRQAEGRPYLRLVAILGVVSLLTASSTLVFRHEGVRRRFGLVPPDPKA